MKSFKIAIYLSLVIGIIFNASSFATQEEDRLSLAKTPPMGWNSWNTFRLEINENLVQDMADFFVEMGFKDAGYEYIVIDDGWQIERDEEGNILASKDKFPSGIKSLSDYIHSKGLKFGIYSDAGYMTCGEFPGSRGYEYQDARQYAKWGVDYLKFDWCFTGNQSAPDSYKLMNDALLEAGRPIVFSICEWGTSKPWTWAKGVGNLWRTTFDIRPCWSCGEKVLSKGVQIENFMGFTKILDLQAGLEVHAGPGHWNDPDMLEVGNGNLSYEENKSHFSLWCILAAPLMLGNDIRTASPEVLGILLNKEAIAVNQDVLGKQGSKVRDDGDLEVWVKPLSGGTRAVVLFNRSDSVQSMHVTWEELNYPQELNANVRDLWLKKEVGLYQGQYSAKVPSHGVVMVKVIPEIK